MFTIRRISALAALSASLLAAVVVAGAGPASAAPDGRIFIQNEGGNQNLDVSEGDVRPGAVVLTYTPNWQDNQKWILDRQNDGTFHIITVVDPDLCVTAGSPQSTAGQIKLRMCDARAAQKWHFSPEGPNIGLLESARYEGLSLAAGDDDAGAVLSPTNPDDDYQRWSFIDAS